MFPKSRLQFCWYSLFICVLHNLINDNFVNVFEIVDNSEINFKCDEVEGFFYTWRRVIGNGIPVFY